MPEQFRLFFESRPVPKPKPLATRLPASVLTSFAIFRRAVRPIDKPPPAALEGGSLATQLLKEYELASFYPAGVRRLAVSAGAREYFVVPAFARHEEVLTAACLRRLKLRANRTRLLERQQRRLVEPVYCFIELPAANVSSGGCEPFAAISQGGNLFSADDFFREPVVELAPDGVALVRISYAGVTPLTVPVRENAFAFTPPPAPASVRAALDRLGEGLLDRDTRADAEQWDETLRRADPMKVEWLGRSGGVIRTIYPPTAASAAATSIGGTRAPIGG